MWGSVRILSVVRGRCVSTHPLGLGGVTGSHRHGLGLELDTLNLRTCSNSRSGSHNYSTARTSRFLSIPTATRNLDSRSTHGPIVIVPGAGACVPNCWDRHDGHGQHGVTLTPRRTFVGVSGARLRKTVFTPEEKSSVPDESEGLVKGDKVMKLNLNSIRLDGVLKAGLQISKSKIEKMFYADRIRVNGERPKKKSQTMREGDEIDIIHKANAVNPEFIDVSRIEIMQLGEEIEDDDEDVRDDKNKKADDDDEDYRIPATLRRFKRLTVENYKQKWKGPVE